jgi:hypothetical protein
LNRWALTALTTKEISMRQLTALALALAVTAAVAAPAAAAEQARVTTTTAAMLGKLLEQADLDYEVEDGGRIKMLYEFTDGRSQLIFLQPLSDLREVGIVEVYSPVMRLEAATVPAALGTRLLEATGSQKIAYFGVEDVEGKPWVFCYHNMPTSGLTSKSLAAVLITVAEIADEMEKEQLGAAKDEF